MHRKFKVVLLLIVLSMKVLHAQEALVKPVRSKKYNLSVCAVFKNEAKYLKEWIVYHRLVGVDHFYLYNNNSVDRFKEVLNPYVKEGVVSLIYWPDNLGSLAEKHSFMWALSTQIPAYENAARLRGPEETEWLVFLDIDEFLVPIEANTLTEVLEKYQKSPGVILSSVFFDASKVDTLPKRNLVIETVELTRAPEPIVERSVEKMIFRPDQCKGFAWPPYHCFFEEGQTAVTLSKREICINHYTDRNKGALHFKKNRGKMQVDSRRLSEDQMRDLLEVGYEIEDQERVIYRFMPEMFRRMGYGPRWAW